LLLAEGGIFVWSNVAIAKVWMSMKSPRRIPFCWGIEGTRFEPTMLTVTHDAFVCHACGTIMTDQRGEEARTVAANERFEESLRMP
jgi:hypothetical protein